jgi:predicted anti-sigma-YlaC factor YlaD
VSVDEIVCREFAELATEYLDGAMPDATLELVEEHLAMCDWCRDYLHQIRATARAVAVAPNPGDAGPAPETLDGLLAAFRATTKRETEP